MMETRVPKARRSHRWSAATVGLLLGALSPLAAESFEATGEVPAASYLPAAELAGPGWRVAATAANDGLVNTYRVESRFPTLLARGRAHVALRGKEVEALEELDRISKSDVFVQAVKASAVGQVQTVTAFATRPVETLQGIGSGAKRWFDRTKLRVQETANDASETYQEHKEKTADGTSDEEKQARKEQLEQAAHAQALSYLKISAAERRWYAELGVDPYTDNQLLRDAIKSYARVEGLTRFGMRFVGLPAIPGIGELTQVMELVWQTDPWDLRKRNRDTLLALGIPLDTARAFEDNPWLTLTQQTNLVERIGNLQGVTGREHLVERALDVESREEASDLTAAVSRLAHLHRSGTPLAAVLPGSQLPVARAADGSLHGALRADALFWTGELAESARRFAEIYAGERTSRRELHVTGRASARFGEECARLGWKIVEAE